MTTRTKDFVLDMYDAWNGYSYRRDELDGSFTRIIMYPGLNRWERLKFVFNLYFI